MQNFLKPNNRIKLFVIIGIIGVILIMLSEVVPSKSNDTKQTNTQDYSYSEYISALEDETADIISSIDGVGKCKVMLTLKDTNESVYAKNTDESSSDSSYSKSYEYVLYDGEDGDTPIVIKQYFPRIQGVVVVCEGGDNTLVREKIIESVSSLFNVSSNKISVSKIKG